VESINTTVKSISTTMEAISFTMKPIGFTAKTPFQQGVVPALSEIKNGGALLLIFPRRLFGFFCSICAL
jgi:hypothetical protein